ncbi:MAG: response regulator [Burkholderiales bacterium]|nr:response regulator [Burkholderiales bacterium]
MTGDAQTMDRVLLLVDDEANILSALSRLFRRDGYRILTATSGAEGLEQLKQHNVGVIISDQRMPGMTGTEFLSVAKQIQPNSVRIVLSGYTELNSVTDAINKGAVFRFLTKPWEDDSLREQVAAAFEHFELKINYQHLSAELMEKNVTLEATTRLLEEALAGAESERDFGASVLQITQRVLHQAPVGIVGFAMDGTIAVANQMAMRLLPGAVIGGAIRPALPEACRAHLTNTDAVNTAVFADGSTCYYRFTPFVSDGVELGTVLTIFPRFDDATHAIRNSEHDKQQHE